MAVTKKSGNINALEWKGEDRINNDDTKYKVEIAKIWEQLGKGKLVTFPYSDFSKYGCSFPADAP